MSRIVRVRVSTRASVVFMCGRHTGQPRAAHWSRVRRFSSSALAPPAVLSVGVTR